MGEFLSNKGRFKDGWDVNGKFPGRPNAHKTRERIFNYAKELILRRNVTVSGDDVSIAVTQEVATMVSQPNFALQAKKLEVKSYLKQKSQPDGYLTFPDWESKEWADARNNFEPHESFIPSESVNCKITALVC